MSRKTLILEPNTEDKLKKLGQRIKKARLRRNISAEMISKQAGIGESTFYAIERGVATVSIGAYAAVLFVLELDSDLDGIATDEAGKVLFWEQNIVERKRAKRRQTDKKLPVPNGITDYRKISSEYYYVDKTLLIRDFIDERPLVSLFTRPTGFGKSLNMDMLRVFFEKSEEDTSVYFQDKKIWKCGKEYQQYQGKYPVIYISFKNVGAETWEGTYDMIYKILRDELERHKKLLQSEKVISYQKAYMEKMLNGEACVVDVSCAFLNLSHMLQLDYGIAPIVIIDEYDVPLLMGRAHGYYDKVVNFMDILLSSGLKDNSHLAYGFLSGVMSIARWKELTGLNNIIENSILGNRYIDYFGFNQEEVQIMLDYYGIAEKYREFLEWEGGYSSGEKEIFNPRSVVEHLANEVLQLDLKSQIVISSLR